MVDLDVSRIVAVADSTDCRLLLGCTGDCYLENSGYSTAETPDLVGQENRPDAKSQVTRWVSDWGR